MTALSLIRAFIFASLAFGSLCAIMAIYVILLLAKAIVGFFIRPSGVSPIRGLRL